MLKQKKPSRYSYADAGVDIKTGDQFVEKIKQLSQSKNEKTSIGGFGALYPLDIQKYKQPLLVSSTDGVGTKLKIAFEMQKYDSIGIDLVAMCVNDIITHGAQPLFFLDYFATGELKLNIGEDVIKGIIEGCEQSDCQLSGGETAEMPGFYQRNEFDLAGFTVGVVDAENALPKSDTIHVGDHIVGLASSGPHSNGYSLIRRLIKDFNIKYEDTCPFDESKTIGEVLIEPTVIYTKPVLKALAKIQIKAMAHITGGGLINNVNRVLPSHTKAVINPENWDIPEVFTWLQTLGKIDHEEIYTTFNMGIGMALICNPDTSKDLIDFFNNEGVKAFHIGHIDESQEKEPSCVITQK